MGNLLTSPIVLVNKYNKNILLTLDNIEENLNIDVYPLVEVDNLAVINDLNAQTSIFETFSSKRAKRFEEDLTVFAEKLLVLLGLKDEVETVKKKRLFGR